jgi:hypothetical protein
VFGDGCVIGDRRWTGSYGVDADVVARVNCSALCVAAADIQVPAVTTLRLRRDSVTAP